jgi:hypothetical protein
MLESRNNGARNIERCLYDRQEAIVINFLAPHELQVCKHFGCGKTLSLREQLLGNKCLIHSGCAQVVGKL